MFVPTLVIEEPPVIVEARDEYVAPAPAVTYAALAPVVAGKISEFPEIQDVMKFGPPPPDVSAEFDVPNFLAAYLVLSMTAVSGVISHAYAGHEKIFHAVVHLSTDKMCLTIIYNFAFALFLLLGKVLLKVVEQIVERVQPRTVESDAPGLQIQEEVDEAIPSFPTGFEQIANTPALVTGVPLQVRLLDGTDEEIGVDVAHAPVSRTRDYITLVLKVSPAIETADVFPAHSAGSNCRSRGGGGRQPQACGRASTRRSRDALPRALGTAHRGSSGGARPGGPDGRGCRAGLVGQAAGQRRLRWSPRRSS